MSDALSFSGRFASASQILQEFVNQLERDVIELSRASSEMAESCRDRLQETWTRWPELTEDFRKSVESLPRELRKHDFVKSALAEIERMESQARVFFSEAGESFAAKRDSLNACSVEMQERINVVSERLSALRDHPLTQKFLRGEMILSDRAHIQWGRKIGHMLNGLGFLYLFEYSGVSRTLCWSLTAVFVLWALSLEAARHVNPKVNAWVCRRFRYVMREREKDKINSAIFFILAMVFVYLVYPRDVGFLTMLFIAIGDPVAGVIGVYFGKRKISQHASLEGTLACFVACAGLSFAAATWAFNEYHLTFAATCLFALCGGIIGTAAEASLKQLDDNLVMPMLSAPGLWLLLQLLSY